jgi:hypothetical protein
MDWEKKVRMNLGCPSVLSSELHVCHEKCYADWECWDDYPYEDEWLNQYCEKRREIFKIEVATSCVGIKWD